MTYTCIDCGSHRSKNSGARCRPCHDKATREFALAYRRSAPITSWCDQCERKVAVAEAARCGSQWCRAKVAA